MLDIHRFLFIGKNHSFLRTFLLPLAAMAQPIKSALHLLLPLGSLLHGIAQLGTRVLSLHLTVNLLDKGSPRSSLTLTRGTLGMLASSACCHYTIILENNINCILDLEHLVNIREASRS